ncbi:hypothetical protein Ddye_026779 [Dipteronia dyeriana]|uniref:CCHC-type domain-containing protein n=1 Tax=Dipteronia dyeriana TaxID=168575 RepID=A0AAD9WPK5_9ROSI|nr:hypothetical protein Ddye_026779 [Dipteronia dyeriana]
MEEVFKFSAQPLKVKPPDTGTTVKRARTQGDEDVGNLRKPVSDSFKAKLISTSSSGTWLGFGIGKEKLKIEDGDISIVEGPNGPAMKLFTEFKFHLCITWASALMLTIMGRLHTLNFLLSKLSQKWPLIGQWQHTNLEVGYFVVRFQMLDDLEFVLTGGPWVIDNQYLFIQKWRSNFVPGEEEIQKMPVWVRLSKLPIEWIDVDLVRSMSGMLCNTYKVDPITESQARGRFAWICVEIDITKPLKSSPDVDDRSIRVEKENLGLICFKCGRVGHSKDNCTEGVVQQNESENHSEVEVDAWAVVADSYGHWMQVSFGRNRKSNDGQNYGVKVTPSIVLAEISNREASIKNQLSRPSLSKYLPDNALDKSYFNKPFKENVDRKGVKGSNKPKIKVDVADNSNFDVVASKLRAAMKVTME